MTWVINSNTTYCYENTMVIKKPTTLENIPGRFGSNQWGCSIY